MTPLEDPWYLAGSHRLERAVAKRPSEPAAARNVVLFVGDGMGITTVAAARVLQGQLAGQTGEESQLFFEAFEHVGLVKTYNTNQQTPDSAGTMSALMTGIKTKAGVISMDDSVALAVAGSGRAVKTLLELAEEAGLSTGVVTTARLTHATPAATYAHVASRDWEDDHLLPDAAKQAGIADIARQLLEFPAGDGLDVAIGGGRARFLPQEMQGPEGERGLRTDGRDLTAEWTRRAPQAAYVHDGAGFDAINPARVTHLLGLFEPDHLRYDRERSTQSPPDPSLAELTHKALLVLRRNPRGFVLVVEGGRIDHAHHDGNAARALQETIAFAEAVQRTAQTVDQQTLIVVTADHSHVLTYGGYAKRGNPILGPVVTTDGRGQPLLTPELAKDGLPYTTLSYANGPGAAPGQRANIGKLDTSAPDFRQPALVPLEYETHGAEDVPLYARGPGAFLLSGSYEQNYVFHVLRHVLRLGGAFTRSNAAPPAPRTAD